MCVPSPQERDNIYPGLQSIIVEIALHNAEDVIAGMPKMAGI